MKYIFILLMLFLLIFTSTCKKVFEFDNPYDANTPSDIWMPDSLNYYIETESILKLTWIQKETRIDGFKIDKFHDGEWQFEYAVINNKNKREWTDTNYLYIADKLVEYRVYAYALNNKSQKKEIIINPSHPGEVTTLAATEVTTNTAKAGGNVTSDGGAIIKARGVCWSTSQKPTLSNFSTNCGIGTGSFTCNLEGLAPNTTYYVRAFAKNSAGASYGNQISLTTSSAGPCWGVTATQGYGIVESSGKCWLDRNLGATQVATSSTDANSYGYLYQWGRGTDGHPIRTSSTTSTLSSSNTPGHSNFILALSSPYDWRSPQNNNLWQGVSGINNPCPPGWRIPTEAEWNAERLSWSSNNSAGAFASPLKLPVAGLRYFTNGSLYNVGSTGNYWSSTVCDTNARLLHFHSSNANMNSDYRAHGGSVRCIKE